MSDKLKKEDLLVAVALITLVFVSYGIKLNIIYSQAPPGTMLDWSDTWSFLSVVEHIKTKGMLPDEDLFFGGIPYVYPPLSLISLAVLDTIVPGDYILFANDFIPLFSSLTVFGIFFLALKLSKNKWVGVFAAYLSLFAPRYMALSTIPTPELFGHLFAPFFMYSVYLMTTRKNRNYAVLAGFAGAFMFLDHHLTSAILILSVSLYVLLLTIVRFELTYVRRLVLMLAVAFLLSSPWWIDTINKNILNLVVKEGGGETPFSYFPYVGGIHIFYLGVPSLIIFGLIGLWKKKPEYLLLFSWGLLNITAVQSRVIVPKVFGFLIAKYPIMYFVLAPIYGTRYFNYMAQPFAIMISATLIGGLILLFGLIRKTIKQENASKVISAGIILAVFLPLIYSTMCFGTGRDDVILNYLNKQVIDKTGFNPYLDSKSWALRSLLPDVNNSYEYKASLWMRDHLPEDAVIVSDYPAGEVISAGALRKISSGAELRSTVNIVGIYANIITLYYTSSDQEAVEVMHKLNATHVYISDRMIERGWFCIESMGRFPEFKNHGLKDAKLEKFDTSPCFKKVLDTDETKIYSTPDRVVLYELSARC